jgi:hypothetical protein
MPYRNRLIRGFLVLSIAATLTAGLAACGGDPEATVDEPVLVDAYPAAGDTQGVTGEGDALVCDPALETVVVDLGTVEYNGSFITYNPEYYTESLDMRSVVLSITGELEGIEAAIVRSHDFYSSADGKESYDREVADSSVNWTEEMDENDVQFSTIDFGLSNNIKSIELCIEPE